MRWYLRSVKGCRPTTREELSRGTRWETESFSNPAGERHLSAALGWRKLHSPMKTRRCFVGFSSSLSHPFYCFFFFFSPFFSTPLPVSATLWWPTEPGAAGTAVSKRCRGISRSTEEQSCLCMEERGCPGRGLLLHPSDSKLRAKGDAFPASSTGSSWQKCVWGDIATHALLDFIES